uniref:Uncharacterized protein n=1 Tax=Cyprinus carpio TaxID=7962 RepID=A0A8C1U3D4_CYPCA
NWRKLKRAARLLLCRLACIPSFLGGILLERLLMIPVHLLICFCRYFRWLTFLLDLTGLSSASLMLLEAESMKLSRSLVVSLKSPPLNSHLSPPRAQHLCGVYMQLSSRDPKAYFLSVFPGCSSALCRKLEFGGRGIILGGRANDVRTSKGRGRGTRGLNSLLTPDHLQLRGICLRHPTE